MGTLRSLIKESKNSKKELVASTVRMPKELHSFVDELAEHLSLSKQEVLLRLIEEGVSVAQDELRLNSVDQEQEGCAFYILNTNKRNRIADHDRMINDGAAAAFYDPWKFNIDRIREGDVVFLYENGVGIVAYGIGTGETLIEDHDGNVGECHYQQLRDFQILPTPLPAHEIKKTLNRNVVFLKTMSGMPDGEKVLKKVKDNLSPI